MVIRDEFNFIRRIGTLHIIFNDVMDNGNGLRRKIEVGGGPSLTV